MEKEEWNGEVARGPWLGSWEGGLQMDIYAGASEFLVTPRR